MVDGFKTEAEMVAAWLRTDFRRSNHRGDWLVYPETAGWDLLLAHRDGYQVGVEAKLSLNPKVIAQALAGQHSTYGTDGPDYRAVLVPVDKCQQHMTAICAAIGLRVLKVRFNPEPWHGHTYVRFPDEDSDYDAWPNWMPSERCPLPEYVPDVAAGNAAPIQLTQWKIKAIKLWIILDRRGFVTRADMKALKISPTRLCDHYHGFLHPGPDRGGYVRGPRTPDLKQQHPRNYAEIEADIATWIGTIDLTVTP